MTLQQLFESEPTSDDISAFIRERGYRFIETKAVIQLYKEWEAGILDVKGDLIRSHWLRGYDR